MNKTPDSPEDTNLIGNPIEVFIKYYNKNIPEAFPHATRKSLNAFKAQYPALFKDDGEWVINKHRKKYMDWLASRQQVPEEQSLSR